MPASKPGRSAADAAAAPRNPAQQEQRERGSNQKRDQTHDDGGRRPDASTLAPTLYVIRHGQTDWNAHTRLLGREDIPLNALGRRQAAAAAATLQWLATDFSQVDFVTGPLGRTRETMAIVRTALGLDSQAYRRDARLIELDYGRWEGETWEALSKTDPAQYQARLADPWNFAMPGGESNALLAERVAPALAELERDTVIVSHGGISRTILALLGGVEQSAATEVEIPQDRVMVVRAGRFAWLQASSELLMQKRW